MTARLPPLPLRRRSRGVSLVEIMVGVAIGLVGTVAIFQAVAAWSRHTQTASAGGDAQVAGTLALFNIERDIKAAGHGFGMAALPVMGCAVTSTLPGPFNLRPVNIQPGAAGAPDTISVLYGNSPFLVAQGTFTSSTATTKTLTRRSGFRKGDAAVVAGPGVAPGSAPCELIQITDDTNLDGLTVSHDVAPYVNFYTGVNGPPQWNGVAAPPAFTTGTIYSLGPQPTLNIWSIAGGRALSRTEQFAATPPIPVAEGVINIKAEYGVDLNNDSVIANAEWQVAPPADFRTVLAIRVAVLVRSRQFERNGDSSATNAAPVTLAVPTYFNYTGAKPFLMTDVNGPGDSNLPGDPSNWRHYRYRVYERVIPLRNVVWGIYPW